jgi:hypothetical protein
MCIVTVVLDFFVGRRILLLVESGPCTLSTRLYSSARLPAAPSLFARDGEEQIVARFMTEEMRFSGVRSAEECATCLNGYDEQESPPGSGQRDRDRQRAAMRGRLLRWAGEYGASRHHQQTELRHRARAGSFQDAGRRDGEHERILCGRVLVGANAT